MTRLLDAIGICLLTSAAFCSMLWPAEVQAQEPYLSSCSATACTCPPGTCTAGACLSCKCEGFCNS